jgi:cystine transport system substrate-binding protein
MKKIITLAAVAALMLCLAACGKKDGNQLDSIKSKGKIVVAMEGTWAPWTYHDETGKLAGFDTEVAKLIADKLGVSVEYVEGEWDGLFAGLETGRYDMVVNGVEITDERKEKYDFTEAYGFIRTALVVKKDNTTITKFEDLQGKKTANSFNSTYMYLGEQYGATVSNVDSLSETIDMVLSGRVDATLNADVSIYEYLSVHPEADIKVVALTTDASEVSIPIRKEGSAELIAAINKAIAELRADGSLKAVSEKYFGQDITTKK